jgi:hypothetical protein
MIQHGMIPEAAEVRLSPEDRAVLEGRLRAPTTEQRDALRARIILLAADGRSTRSIARTVGTMPRTVSLWRGRFAREGLVGLTDKPRPGPTAKYGAESGRRILAVLDKPPPAGFARWTGPRGDLFHDVIRVGVVPDGDDAVAAMRAGNASRFCQRALSPQIVRRNTQHIQNMASIPSSPKGRTQAPVIRGCRCGTGTESEQNRDHASRRCGGGAGKSSIILDGSQF